MKVLVMGGGVIGVTTVWQLLKDGHEVTLVEQLGAAVPELVNQPSPVDLRTRSAQTEQRIGRRLG